MAGRSRNRLTQRSLSEINELSGIGQSYCDIFGSRLNQAKRIAPKRLEQRGPKSGACLPSVPVPAKVRFIGVPYWIRTGVAAVRGQTSNSWGCPELSAIIAPDPQIN